MSNVLRCYLLVFYNSKSIFPGVDMASVSPRKDQTLDSVDHSNTFFLCDVFDISEFSLRCHSAVQNTARNRIGLDAKTLNGILLFCKRIHGLRIKASMEALRLDVQCLRQGVA